MKTKRLSAIFSATVLGLSSLLNLGIVPLVGATPHNCTWTGATNSNFNTASNWSGCNNTVPQNGDSLVFDSTNLTSNPTLNNDITGLSVANITFTGTNSDYGFFGLQGNSLTLTGNITVSMGGTSFLRGAISNDIILSGNSIFNVSLNNDLLILGVISGTGNITKSGAGPLELQGTNTFTGNVTANGGSIEINQVAGLGNAANNITINDSASLALNGTDCSQPGYDFPYNLTVSGTTPDTVNNPKLELEGCGSYSAFANEYYGRGQTGQNRSYVLSGTITLGSDVIFGSSAKAATITGSLQGNFKFLLPGADASNWGGSLTVNSSNNTSDMPNGTYDPDPIVQTLNDDQSADTVYIGATATITIDGQRGDTLVDSGGILKGTGTVGALDVGSDGTIAPGHSPGCLNTGDLTENGTYQVEIGGTTACTGYDQLNVTGTVDVSNGTLDVSRFNDFRGFKKGQTFTIINNDGADAVTGTFAGLAEGATLTLDDGTVLSISYQGGDGNDVVLTVEQANLSASDEANAPNVPGVPNTGFAMIAAHPAMTLGLTSLLAGGILLVARRLRLLPANRRK